VSIDTALWALSNAGGSPRNLARALAFGLMTNVLPWLVMFPSMGYGGSASGSASPPQASAEP
jgi:hypothetical protein